MTSWSIHPRARVVQGSDSTTVYLSEAAVLAEDRNGGIWKAFVGAAHEWIRATFAPDDYTTDLVDSINGILDQPGTCCWGRLFLSVCDSHAHRWLFYAEYPDQSKVLPNYSIRRQS